MRCATSMRLPVVNSPDLVFQRRIPGLGPGRRPSILPRSRRRPALLGAHPGTETSGNSPIDMAFVASLYLERSQHQEKQSVGNALLILFCAQGMSGQIAHLPS